MSLDDLLNGARTRLPLLRETSPLSPFTSATPQPAETPQSPAPPSPPQPSNGLSVAPVPSPQVNALQPLQAKTQSALASLSFSPATQPQVNPSLGPLLNGGQGGFGSPGADISAAVMDNVARLRGVDPHGSYTGPDIKAKGNRVIALAKTQLGVPYDMGAYDPRDQQGGELIDCSGLTKWVFSRLGLELPHSAAQQSQMFPKISVKQLRPGDLIFYDYGRLGGASDHVAIYAGNGQQIAASSSSGGVVVQGIDYDNVLWGGRTPLSAPNPQRQRRANSGGSNQQR